MSEKFNGLKIGDFVQSRGMLNAFPSFGVVRELFEANGHEYAIYEDRTGKWQTHASELTKETGQ